MLDELAATLGDAGPLLAIDGPDAAGRTTLALVSDDRVAAGVRRWSAEAARA